MRGQTYPSECFFFNDTSPPEISTLPILAVLPISDWPDAGWQKRWRDRRAKTSGNDPPAQDRKSTRLNSSHSQISYAVFCLKKKQIRRTDPHPPSHSHSRHCTSLRSQCDAVRHHYS